MYSHKLRAARSFVRANRLNRVVYGAGALHLAAAALPVPLSFLRSSEKGSKDVLTQGRVGAALVQEPTAPRRLRAPSGRAAAGRRAGQRGGAGGSGW